ncbi:SMP-30/gluconolactonase/LRE family protein [Oceaniserpentilla sp. 4NH20-0058]|uniref:SMP-30/gluconolactonase/LRE family protein n=1 Tax=Oceaniserpentilla sp. 4NH20-0058 TaxID=3127660 RepID=UPI003108D3BA
MIKKIALSSTGLLAAYLCFWPVPVEPVAWQSPTNPGYTGAFAKNQQLSQVNRIELTNSIGPEDLDKDANGNVYFSLLNGDIDYIDPQGNIQTWVNTGGRPLGIEFDNHGNLIVADAFKGLLSVSPDKTITVLADSINGQPINYADDVDIAANGMIYFSDASSKFVAKDHGTYGASLLDTMEHGGHGSILEYNPQTKQTTVLASGINFANGVAMSHDQQSVLFNETGTYRVLRVGLNGENRGKISVVIDELPGFPDNISQGSNGVYWLGLVSPRSGALDALSDSPFLRKLVQRLPAAIRPKAQHYGHIVAINDKGGVVFNLQDPLGMYGLTTGALEVDGKLYISSLHETALAVTSNINVSEQQMAEGQVAE